MPIPRRTTAIAAGFRRFLSSIERGSNGGSVAQEVASLLGPRTLAEWMQQLDGASLHELVVASRRLSGYQREAAVRLLARTGNPAALGALLERVNDWVPQVRRAALEAAERLLTDPHAAAWIAALPLLERLSLQRRADHSALHAGALELILRPAHRQALLAAIKTNDLNLARAAARLCVERRLAEPAVLVELLIAQRDVVARDMVAGLLRQLEGSEFESAAERLIHDRHMSVRREALQLLLARRPERGLHYARQALFDPGSWIRSISLRALRTHGVDTLPLLRAALRPEVSPRRQRAALYGLADAHREIAAEHVLPYTQHPLPSLRRAALQALARCSPDLARPRLLQGLCDTSPSVVSSSGRQLRTHDQALTLAELEHAMLEAQCERTFDACLICARTLSKWDELILLLDLCQKAFADARNTHAALDALRAWNYSFNRKHALCTSAQRARIEGLLDALAPQLPSGLVATLRFSL